MSYGQRIKRIREKKGVKACYVAQRIGMTPGGYNGIEKGRTKLTVEKALQIACVLGVDIREFFFDSEVSDSLNRPPDPEPMAG